MAWLDGLLGNLDPNSATGMQLSGLLGGLSAMGAGLSAAGAPRPVGQPGPSMADAFGAYGQGQQRALMSGMQTRQLSQQMRQEAAWKDAATGTPTTPEGKALYEGVPATRRSAIFQMGPQMGMEALKSLLTQRPVALSPGQRLAGLDGVGEQVPYTAADFAYRGAGAPRVSVDARAMGAGMTQAYEQTAKAWQTGLQAAQDANKRATLFNTAEAAMEGFTPGIAANLRLKGQQAMAELGLPNNAAPGELLLSVQRQIELANTPRGQGQITENERVLIREMNNIFGATPEGAKTMIAATRELDRREMEIARIYQESARKNGGAPNPVEVSEAILALPPALSPATMAQIRKLEAQGRGPQPPTREPPKVTTVQDYEKLRSGEEFIAPDGTRRRKP